MSKVSVIMPAYNVQDYIEESIHSVQKQEYENWELIVVDDGSTDETVNVVESLRKQDGRIRLLQQRNQGVSVARNRGIEEAQGKFISFLDGDDLWEKSFLLKMVERQEATGKKIVFCGYNRLFSRGKIGILDNFYPTDENVLYHYANLDFKTNIGALLIERESLIKSNIRFFQGCSIGEDLEFIYKLLVLFPAAVVGETLMLYRRREGSVSRKSWSGENALTAIFAFERVKKFFYVYVEENHEIRIVLPLIEHLINYAKSDFLWKTLKKGNYKLVEKYLREGWKEAVIDTVKSPRVKRSKKLKYKMVLKKYKLVWSILKIFNKTR